MRFLRWFSTPLYGALRDGGYFTVEDRGYTSPCWVWARTLNANGYGSLHCPDKRRKRGAHRVVYEQLVGPVPDGLELDHLCRVRACVNPEHLEPVTHAENMRRGGNGMKTHCPHGHPYDEANTYHSPSGQRKCRACKPMLRAKRRAAEQPPKPPSKTHCKHGHPFDEENTGWNAGERYCRTCNRDAAREYYHRRKREQAEAA